MRENKRQGLLLIPKHVKIPFVLPNNQYSLLLNHFFASSLRIRVIIIRIRSQHSLYIRFCGKSMSCHTGSQAMKLHGCQPSTPENSRKIRIREKQKTGGLRVGCLDFDFAILKVLSSQSCSLVLFDVQRTRITVMTVARKSFLESNSAREFDLHYISLFQTYRAPSPAGNYFRKSVYSLMGLYLDVFAL